MEGNGPGLCAGAQWGTFMPYSFLRDFLNKHARPLPGGAILLSGRAVSWSFCPHILKPFGAGQLLALCVSPVT